MDRRPATACTHCSHDDRFSQGRNVTNIARDDIAAEDWLDTQVPAPNTIWYHESEEVDERLAEILFLKFFRLSTLSASSFEGEILEMDLEWQLYRSSLQEFDSLCVGVRPFSEPRSELVNRFCGFVHGSFASFELVSSRLACQTGCGPLPAGEPDHRPATRPERLVSDLAFAQEESFVAAMHHFLEIREYRSRTKFCKYLEDWPPVTHTYTDDFRSLVSIHFANTVWGKYLFRIHSLVGAFP